MAVPTRIFSQIDLVSSDSMRGGSNTKIVETPTGKLYMVYGDFNADVVFSTSLDGGITWSTSTVLKAMTEIKSISVWYDRWSGIDADLIHVIYNDVDSDDVFYRNINVANSDSLSTEYTVFAGATAANGGSIFVSRMRGGNLIALGVNGTGAEYFSCKSTNVGINWSNIASVFPSSSQYVQAYVLPGWGADNQDAMVAYFTYNTTPLQSLLVKYYDDSANSWSSVTVLNGTVVFPNPSSASRGHFSASVDLTNSQNVLVLWNAIDTANADLQCFKITQSAQTETSTQVVSNSTDDQGFAGISIDQSGNWYVFYGGKSDGSETWNTIINIYYKKSTDSGATWGSETLLNDARLILPALNSMYASPQMYKHLGVALLASGSSSLYYNAKLSIPRTTYQLGI